MGTKYWQGLPSAGAVCGRIGVAADEHLTGCLPELQQRGPSADLVEEPLPRAKGVTRTRVLFDGEDSEELMLFVLYPRQYDWSLNYVFTTNFMTLLYGASC